MSERIKDQIVFENNFSFDENVTECFSDMISRSIPGYDSMRYLVYNISKNYVKHKTDIVDIGCSNGESINPFIQHYGAVNTYRLIDNSKPMIEAVKKRYSGLIDAGVVNIYHHDLTNGLPMQFCSSVIISCLTLQFVPIEYRTKILTDVYNSLIDGGCFIFVEKLLCNSSDTNNIFVNEYYNIKRQNGYTDEQIETKRKALQNVLVPLTEQMNIELLRHAGFKTIDCFWRCLNFAGYICVK